MSSSLKKHIRKAPVCHKCGAELKGKRYMTYKEEYGWVCERCGYQRKIDGWKGARI